MKIGKVPVRNRVFLAPMVDITTLPYRLLCQGYGAGMVYSEMVVAQSLIYGSPSALASVKTCKEERPFGVQLAGNDSKVLLAAAEKTMSDLLDLNFGCPSYKVLGNDMCSALLNQPDKIKKIVSYLVDNLDRPITAKIRLGYNKKNYISVASFIENAGASALCVHGRMAIDGYDTPADWTSVKELKKILSIPIIGNGDVRDGKSAQHLLDTVDFVMVGRAAIGDPFIFDRINRYLKNKEIVEKPMLEEKYSSFLMYLKLCKKYNMEDFTMIHRLSLSFAKNVLCGAKLRRALNFCKNVDDIKSTFERFI